MSAIFSKKLRRFELLNTPVNSSGQNTAIYVHRNHSFELVASVLNVFLSFSGISAQYTYSAYDDSFNFGVPPNTDLHLLWIDLNRYKPQDHESFLQDRIGDLRSKTNAPILVAYIGANKLNTAEVFDELEAYVWNAEESLRHFDEKAFDLAKEAYSGTRLSGEASLYVARDLGLKYIPAMLQPALKGLVVDLDNTLYQGVLGEDGIEALVPNLPLQQRIKDLKEQGFFVTLASKNEEEDAIALFKQRTDFILKWSDFDAVAINWEPKAQNIVALAQKLNIGTDSLLFIDDNPAEIQNVEGLSLKTILADNPEKTVKMLEYFPGLLKLRSSLEDSLRSKDLKANEQRVKMAKALPPEEYFKKLGIKLTFSLNNDSHIARVAELLGKTNQFILTYARSNATDVRMMMDDADKCVITVAMADNLADSGIIAILLASGREQLVVEELVVSCRALGRNLENIMIPKMFSLAAQKLGFDCQDILIPYKKGERNGPALTWLGNFLGQELDEDSGVLSCRVLDDINLSGLEIEVDG